MLIGTLSGAVSFLDRSILNILAEPIKRELHFSDTELGLLTGFAFALFYSVMGLPIARYVDRPTTRRPWVISACMVLWSGMTMVSGLAATYAQLLTARILVAVGESGAGPAVMTMIDHYVPREKRSRMFGLYGLGVPLGMFLGLGLGGWLVDQVGWRAAFFLVGAPGILLGLSWLFMWEPRLTAPAPVAAPVSAQKPPTLAENFLVIVRIPALLWLTVAAAMGGMYSVGLPSWAGVYMIRVLDLSATQTGIILGLIMGVGGGIGSFFGGLLADRLAAKDPGRALLVPGIGLLIGMPAAMLAFTTNDWRIFTALFWIPVLGAASYFGPVFSMVQQLVPPSYRATTLVLVIMLANLIGAGLGPFLIGLLSDLLQPHFGIESLRWALVAGYAVSFVPAYFYIKARALAGEQVARIAADHS